MTMMVCRYLVIFELYPPSFAGVGWALEHRVRTFCKTLNFHPCNFWYQLVFLLTQNSFQAMDSSGLGNAWDNVPRLAYHMTHHMMHSFHIPRVIVSFALASIQTFLLMNFYFLLSCGKVTNVVSSLYVSSSVDGENTPFVFYAEGFAQYLAFQALGRTGRIPLNVTLEMLAYRYGNSYASIILFSYLYSEYITIYMLEWMRLFRHDVFNQECDFCPVGLSPPISLSLLPSPFPWKIFLWIRWPIRRSGPSCTPREPCSPWISTGTSSNNTGMVSHHHHLLSIYAIGIIIAIMCMEMIKKYNHDSIQQYYSMGNRNTLCIKQWSIIYIIIII